MIILVVIMLLAAIAVLFAYNFQLQKNLEAYQNLSDKISDLTVLQNFMKVAGSQESVEDKLNQINEIVIEKYDIKYSTIVVFDGAEYVIKATNVDKIHHETLTNLHTEEIFQDSVATATPKYITIDNENEKLPYQKVEMGRAKSAMFFPLYIENIYIGYWIMESGRMHAFDKTDTTIIEVVKDNIISVLSTMSYQDAMENIIRVDKFTGLYSAEYLYSKAKKTFDKYPTSAVCMFKIANLDKINKEQSREIGNEIVTEVSNTVKGKLPAQYVFVRYMGPKFVIVFSGVEEGSVEQFLKELQTDMESIVVTQDAEEKPVVKTLNGKRVKVRELIEEKSASPKINFVVSTYYKGTGIEQLNRKLEEYIDTMDVNSPNSINYI